MKRSVPILLVITAALFISTVRAQNTMDVGAVPAVTSSKYYKIQKAQKERWAFKSSGTTLFYDDFENGLAGNNNFGAWTTGGQDAAIWEHDFDGSEGQFWGTRDSLLSTSAVNGWMLFDGDGSNPGDPVDFVNREGYLISPVMDITGFPDVHLEFEQYFRFCCSFLFKLRVAVSTDGFLTSTEYVVSDPFDRNEDSPNPHVQRLSISSALIGGDLSNVQVRFQWEGLDEDPNGQGTSHYYWMVDDVAIVESPNNDIALTQAEYSDFAGTGEMQYTVYSYDQVRPLTLKGWLLNDGIIDQTGVVMNVDVTGDTPFSGSTAGLDITSLMRDSAIVTSQFTPSATTSDYLVEYSVSQDQVDDNPVNGDTTSTFRVEEFIFARDGADLDGSTDNQGEAYELCNWFDITADADLTSIDVAFDDRSNIGVIVDGIIYDTNRDYYGETVNEFETETSDLNALGEANYKHLLMLDPLTLFAGESYLICVRHFGGVDTLAIGTSLNSYPQTSLIYDTPTTTWFFTTETPMVRANFDPDISIGIDENVLTGIELLGAFPNPSQNGTEIRFNLNTAKKLDFELLDVTGKLVFAEKLGTLSSGIHRHHIDTSSLEAGVYFYSLSAIDGKLSQRLVVIK